MVVEICVDVGDRLNEVVWSVDKGGRGRTEPGKVIRSDQSFCRRTRQLLEG